MGWITYPFPNFQRCCRLGMGKWSHSHFTGQNLYASEKKFTGSQVQEKKTTQQKEAKV